MESHSKRANREVARRKWGVLSRLALRSLDEFSERFGLRVAAGDLKFISGNWYLTNAGLLRLAQRRRCAAIQTRLEKSFCDSTNHRWVFKAVWYKSAHSRGFVGYGDADPSNVSPLVRGAEMRVAETRAVNRALRKAYGIGLCSVEELGWTPKAADAPPPTREVSPANGNGGGAHGASTPRLRDRLCLLIRQHRLDPSLVKSYAADFCGTPSLHLANRERLEAFVSTLSQRAATDRDALVCHLNSFSRAKEVHP